jgi:hypothetical protein
MPSELGEFIEEKDAMMGERSLARQGHLTAANQPHIGNGLVGGATRPGGDDGGAPPGAAGDEMDAGGVDGFGQGQIGEDRRQTSGQHRCPRPGRPQEQDVMVRMPALPSQ